MELGIALAAPPRRYGRPRPDGALAAKRKKLANLSKKIYLDLEYFSTAVITRFRGRSENSCSYSYVNQKRGLRASKPRTQSFET
jgi:hypothetical protein